MSEFGKNMLDILEDNRETACIGLTFKGHVTVFSKQGRVERRESLNIMRRLSCKGCPKCGWIRDELQETINMNKLIMPPIEEGMLYTIQMVNVSTDWESGYVDDYDMEVIPLVGDTRQ
jgi:hypothetical protein